MQHALTILVAILLLWTRTHILVVSLPLREAPWGRGLTGGTPWTILTPSILTPLVWVVTTTTTVLLLTWNTINKYMYCV